MVFFFRKQDAGSEQLCGGRRTHMGSKLYSSAQCTAHVKSLHNIQKGNWKLPLTEIYIGPRQHRSQCSYKSLLHSHHVCKTLSLQVLTSVGCKLSIRVCCWASIHQCCWSLHMLACGDASSLGRLYFPAPVFLLICTEEFKDATSPVLFGSCCHLRINKNP